jgi:hypothetical protein
MSLVILAIGIDHGDLDTVYHSNRVDPNLAVPEPVVLPFDGRTIEYPGRISESDGVPADIRKVLVRVPGELHIGI